MSNPEDDIPDDEVMPTPVLADEVPKPKNKGGRPKKVRVIDQTQPNMTTAPLGRATRVRAAINPASDTPPEGSLLTKAEIEEIRRQAKADALEELRSGQKKELKAKLLRQERLALSPQSEEEIVGFTLEMPSYAMQWPLVIDGVWYFHGKYYEVPLSKYEVFAEQMYRSFEHQRVIDGKSIAEDGRRQYREQLPGSFLSGKQVAA